MFLKVFMLYAAVGRLRFEGPKGTKAFFNP